MVDESTGGQIPDDTWTTEQILKAIEHTIGDANPQMSIVLVEALDVLSRRKIEDPGAATTILLETAKRRSLVSNEPTMLAELLARQANEDSDAFELLKKELNIQNKGAIFWPCISSAIKLLSEDKRNILAPLLPAIIIAEPTRGVAGDLMHVLAMIKNPAVRGQISRYLVPFLKTSNGVEVEWAARIARQVGDASISSDMLLVLERVTREWYPGLTGIQDSIGGYFQRHQNEKALPILLKVLQSSPRIEIARAVAAFRSATAFSNLLELIGCSIADYKLGDSKKYEVVSVALEALKTEPSLIDIDRMLSFEQLLYWPGTQATVEEILIEIGAPAHLLLFNLLKSPKKETYGFASVCLSKLGVSREEIFAAFDPSPITQLNLYFFGEEKTSQKLLESGELGGTLFKADIKRSEFIIMALLNDFNFITLYVDKAGKAGVDLLALSPSGLRLLVIGVTSSHLKDDLQKLNTTLALMRKTIPMLSRYEVIPIVVCDETMIHPGDSEYASETGIVILLHSDIEQIIDMSIARRSSEELMQFFESKLPSNRLGLAS